MTTSFGGSSHVFTARRVKKLLQREPFLIIPSYPKSAFRPHIISPSVSPVNWRLIHSISSGPSQTFSYTFLACMGHKFQVRFIQWLDYFTSVLKSSFRHCQYRVFAFLILFWNVRTKFKWLTSHCTSIFFRFHSTEWPKSPAV